MAHGPSRGYSGRNRHARRLVGPGRWRGLLICALALAILALAACLAGASAPPPQVLILNSYHPGYPWSDAELAGATGSLRQGRPGIHLAIEFLDAKNHPGPDYQAKLADLLRYKYQDRPPALVLTLDNAALDLALKHRQDLLAGAPIVFCGVNGFTPQMLAGQGGITGVTENLDCQGTLDLILRLHPGTKRVVVVHDFSSTGLGARDELVRAQPRYQDRLEFTYLENMPLAELLKRMAALGPGSVGLILSYAMDSDGRVYDYDRVAERICAASPVPVYGFHRTRLGHGIVGGSLLDGHEHGRRAAQMALTVLAGQDPSQMPIDRNPGARLMFDYKALARFGISLDALPAGSTVINQPYSFWEENRALATTAVLAFLTLVLAVTFLTTMLLGRRKAEREIRSLARFPAENPNPVSRLDKNGQLLYANPPARELLGLLGQAPGQGVPPHWRQAAAQALAQGRAQQEVVEAGQRSFLVTFTPIGAEGQVNIYGMDVSERRQAQEALMASERKYRVLAEQSLMGIAILSGPPVHLLYANPRFAQMLGYSLEDLSALDEEGIWGLVHPDDRPAVQSRSAARLAGQEVPTQYQLRALRADGSVIWLDMAAQRIELDSGPAVQMSLADITDRKLAELENIRLEAQLLQSQKMEAVGTLAGGIAHDFNNILGAIMGFAELAQELAAEGQDNTEELGQILAASERAGKLVSQIMTISRRNNADFRPLDLGMLIGETVTLLRQTLPRMIEIETHVDPGLNLVNGDANQWEQILLNLANNARDAMPQGGRLVLEAQNLEIGEDFALQVLNTPPGPYVSLQVSDNGLGMDRETVKRVFEPFFTTKGPGKGTGLGLSTVYGIVQNHGGHISCYSELGIGTTFRIYLPALVADDSLSPAPRASAPKVPLGVGEELLLVDDESALLELGSRILKSAGYRISTAGTAEDAVALWGQHEPRFDLVIMDLGMPGKGGQWGLESILGQDPKAKVIIASGYSANVQGREALEKGALGLVAKPYHREELLRAVRRALEHGNRQSA